MKQIRIARNDTTAPSDGPRFVCEWMEASLMNRWFIKMRLAEALQIHGERSHWIETREKVQAREMEVGTKASFPLSPPSSLESANA